MDVKYERVGDAVIKLIEECSELIHILCKAKRFGWNSYHPGDSEQRTNRDLVYYEIRDVEKRIRELEDELRLMK